tara:strand:+ start:275 stop:463 length:189 start_codon:yes stop_codon:yes gene_type:complete
MVMKIEKYLREEQINEICDEVKNEIFELISMELSANGVYKHNHDKLINENGLVSDILKRIFK